MEYSRYMDIHELATLVAMKLMAMSGMENASEHPEEWDLDDPTSVLNGYILTVGEIINTLNKMGYIQNMEDPADVKNL